MSRSDIDALNATFVKAMEAGDAAMMASVYAPDARLLPPGSPVVEGSAAIEQFWRGLLEQGPLGGALKTVSLEELGDVAVEEGQYEMRAGGTVVDVGKYVVVHRRQPDGSWKWARDIFNSDQATVAS
ncbi:YybH family protein [Geodermatophilus sp. SYSU D00742]